MKDMAELSRQAQNMRRWQHARYAERVLMSGRLVHPDAAHGQLRSYTSYGCRGSLCFVTWKNYSLTGETVLPIVGNQQFSAHDCVTFESDIYVDRRP